MCRFFVKAKPGIRPSVWLVILFLDAMISAVTISATFTLTSMINIFQAWSKVFVFQNFFGKEIMHVNSPLVKRNVSVLNFRLFVAVRVIIFGGVDCFAFGKGNQKHVSINWFVKD